MYHKLSGLHTINVGHTYSSVPGSPGRLSGAIFRPNSRFDCISAALLRDEFVRRADFFASACRPAFFAATLRSLPEAIFLRDAALPVAVLGAVALRFFGFCVALLRAAFFRVAFLSVTAGVTAVLRFVTLRAPPLRVGFLRATVFLVATLRGAGFRASTFRVARLRELPLFATFIFSSLLLCQAFCAVVRSLVYFSGGRREVA
jgi:hypothetical protein